MCNKSSKTRDFQGSNQFFSSLSLILSKEILELRRQRRAKQKNNARTTSPELTLEQLLQKGKVENCGDQELGSLK
jgi:hypothetical protein